MNAICCTHNLRIGYPVSTNRYYRTYRNVTTLSKEGRLFKQNVRLNNLGLKPSFDEVELNITIHPKRKKNGATFKQVIDLDNGLKCILDSLIGVAYQDDKQVKAMYVKYGSSIVGGATTVVVYKFVSKVDF